MYYFLFVYKTHSLHASLLAGTAFAAVRRESRKQGDTDKHRAKHEIGGMLIYRMTQISCLRR